MATSSDIILYKVNSQGKFVETLFVNETYNYLLTSVSASYAITNNTSTTYSITNIITNNIISLKGAVYGTGTSSIITSLTNSVVGISNLTATGTPNSTTYLRGDNTWATISGGGGSSQWTTSGSNIYFMSGNVLIGKSLNIGTYSLQVSGSTLLDNGNIYTDGSGKMTIGNNTWVNSFDSTIFNFPSMIIDGSIVINYDLYNPGYQFNYQHGQSPISNTWLISRDGSVVFASGNLRCDSNGVLTGYTNDGMGNYNNTWTIDNYGNFSGIANSANYGGGADGYQGYTLATQQWVYNQGYGYGGGYYPSFGDYGNGTITDYGTYILGGQCNPWGYPSGSYFGSPWNGWGCIYIDNNGVLHGGIDPYNPIWQIDQYGNFSGIANSANYGAGADGYPGYTLATQQWVSDQGYSSGGGYYPSFGDYGNGMITDYNTYILGGQYNPWGYPSGSYFGNPWAWNNGDFSKGYIYIDNNGILHGGQDPFTWNWSIDQSGNFSGNSVYSLSSGNSTYATYQDGSDGYGGILASQAWVNAQGYLILSNTITTTSTSLTLEQTGDTYGTTKLILGNRYGFNGARFINNGLDIVDFSFQSNSGAYSNIRFENRNGFKLSNNINGEFQFLSPNDNNYSYFQIGYHNTSLTNGNLLIGTQSDYSNGILQLSGSLSFNKLGNKINILTGSNSIVGTFSLSSGIKVISNTSVTNNSLIYLNHILIYI